MGDALDLDFSQQRQHGLDVDLGRGQQRFAQGLASQGLYLFFQIGVLHVEDLADEGETVGVNAGGGQSEDDVAFLHGLVVDDGGFIHDAGGIAGQVVFIFGVEARHLRGLAADEGSSRLPAAVRHALDDLGDALGHVLAAGDVVQEEQGLGAAADDVVDAHGDAVDADGIVLVHQEGDAQFRTDAVGAGDEDGLAHAGEVGGEQSAEASDVSHNAFGVGALDAFLHEFHGFVARGDVHAGSGVGFGSGIFHGVSPYSLPSQQ